jgi:hypothetical protein
MAAGWSANAGCSGMKARPMPAVAETLKALTTFSMGVSESVSIHLPLADISQ